MVTDAPVAVTLPLNELLDPTVTLPKLKALGEIDNCPDAPPVPDSGMFRVVFDAFEVIARFPVTLPVIVGA